MGFKKDILNVVMPLLRGAPFIAIILACTYLSVSRMVDYMTPKYRAAGAIRINLKENHLAEDLFPAPGGGGAGKVDAFIAEIEVFKSREILRKTFERLDFELDLYRVGEMKTLPLIDERPFRLQYEVLEPRGYDKLFYLVYQGDGRFSMGKSREAETHQLTFRAGEEVVAEGLRFTLRLNEPFLREKPHSLKPGDCFAFRINSIDGLINGVSDADLFIKPVDKDVPILKIYYLNEVPERAMKFVNALMEAYMENYREKLEKKADEMLAYLDVKLDSAERALRQAEAELAAFKTANGLVNPTQESDALLKETMQLNNQKVDLELQRAELRRLFDYLASGNDLRDFTPNFQALKEDVFRTTYLKIQDLELQKHDLLIKYPAHSEEVMNVQYKINELRTMLNESVRNTIGNLELRLQKIDREMAEVDATLKSYPEKQRRLVELEREVQLREAMYNYLSKRRTELAIARSANLYPHQIIDRALLPTTPSSPNRPLILGVTLFFALLLGMAVAYAWDYWRAKVTSTSKLEDLMSIPVLGELAHVPEGQWDSFELHAKIVAKLTQLFAHYQNGMFITVASYAPLEGKTFAAAQIGRALAQTGKRVLLIDLDIWKPSLHELVGTVNFGGVSGILAGQIDVYDAPLLTQTENLELIPAGDVEACNPGMIFSEEFQLMLQSMGSIYDVIIVDTPPLSLAIDAVAVMQQSHLNLFVVRARYSKVRKVKALEKLIREWELFNSMVLLNDVRMKPQGLKKYRHEAGGWKRKWLNRA